MSKRDGCLSYLRRLPMFYPTHPFMLTYPADPIITIRKCGPNVEAKVWPGYSTLRDWWLARSTLGVEHIGDW